MTRYQDTISYIMPRRPRYTAKQRAFINRIKARLPEIGLTEACRLQELVQYELWNELPEWLKS